MNQGMITQKADARNPSLFPRAWPELGPAKRTLCERDWWILSPFFPQLCFLSTGVTAIFPHGIWEGSSLGLGWKMPPQHLATVSEILEVLEVLSR